MTIMLDVDVIEDATTGLLDHGEDPNLTSHDHEVQFINNASEVLRDRVGQGEDMDDEASRYVVWLGGLNRDVMLYGLQRILKPQPIDVVFEDKAQARIDTMQERLDNTPGYMAKDFKGIDHHAWPVTYLDGSTHEDRLQELAEELAPPPEDMTTADMILSGTASEEELHPTVSFMLIGACLDQLKPLAQDPNIVYYERLNRFIGWLLTQSPEVGIMGMRSLLAIYKLPVTDRKALPNLAKITSSYVDLIKASWDYKNPL